MALEWREEDGSRWIATVDLTPQWKDYALPPERFKAWPVGSVPEERRFNPANAVSCTVGLALSHTALEGDEHEYWFAALGTAPNPFGAAVPQEDAEHPSAGVHLTQLSMLPDHDAGHRETGPPKAAAGALGYATPRRRKARRERCSARRAELLRPPTTPTRPWL